MNTDKKDTPVISLAISTPVIETTIVADEEHTVASFIAGFTRFSRNQSNKVWNFIQALSLSETPLTKEAVCTALESVPQLKEFAEAGDYSEEALMLTVTHYMRDLGVTVDGKETSIDTRYFKDVEIDDAVHMIMQHNSFYEVYVAGFIKSLKILAISSSTLADDEAKN